MAASHVGVLAPASAACTASGRVMIRIAGFIDCHSRHGPRQNDVKRLCFPRFTIPLLASFAAARRSWTRQGGVRAPRHRERSCTDPTRLQTAAGQPRQLPFAQLARNVRTILHKFRESTCKRSADDDAKVVSEELKRFAKWQADGQGWTAAEIAANRAQLDTEHAVSNDGERVFQEVKRAKLTGAPMPDMDVERFADAVNERFKYKTCRLSFQPSHYVSFDDWFLRKLSEETLQRCIATAACCDVCCPAQGRIWNRALHGEMTLKVSIIVADELLRLLGSDSASQLLQIKLQPCDYHRVHSPVDGLVAELDTFEKDGLFPGAEALMVVTLQCAFGMVKLLCIGEWSVQSFVSNVVIGQEVRRMDELGHFDLGSQVLLILPDGVRIERCRCKRVFPGDCIGKLQVAPVTSLAGSSDVAIPPTTP